MWLPAFILGLIGLFKIKKHKKGLAIVGIVIVMVSLIISLLWVPNLLGLGKKDFNDMFPEYKDQYWCEIAYDGSWMEVDTNAYDLDDYNNSATLSKIKSINTELGFSSSVYQEMISTRSLDGRQYAYTDGYSASWTYHPDKGLEVMYKIID